jgi:tetratricopeptide (TPR) repeat protein
MWQPIRFSRCVKAAARRGARDVVRKGVRTLAAWPLSACVCLAVAGGGATVRAVTQPAATAVDAIAEARRLVDAGSPQAALDRLGPSADEDDPRVLHIRGLALYHLGDAARAIPLLERASRHLPLEGDRDHAIEVLGLSLMLEGRAADALPHLTAAVQARRSPEVAHVLAQAAVQVGEPDKGRRALALALGLPDDRAEVWVALGQLMARMDAHEPAEAALREALARNPSVLQANYLLGQEALFRGRLDEAVTLTRRELALHPLDAMSHVQLGDALSRMGRWEDAIPTLQRAIWLNPYYSAPYILLGRGHLQAGHPDLAEGMVRRAIAFDPNNRAAHYLLGQVLQRQGRTEAAKEAFTRAEQLQQQGRR